MRVCTGECKRTRTVYELSGEEINRNYTRGSKEILPAPSLKISCCLCPGELGPTTWVQISHPCSASGPSACLLKTWLFQSQSQEDKAPIHPAGLEILLQNSFNCKRLLPSTLCIFSNFRHKQRRSPTWQLSPS